MRAAARAARGRRAVGPSRAARHCLAGQAGDRGRQRRVVDTDNTAPGTENNDRLNGPGGNDSLNSAGGGADTLFGEGGANDVAFYVGGVEDYDVVTVSAAGSIYTVRHFLTNVTDTLYNIEFLRYSNVPGDVPL